MEELKMQILKDIEPFKEEQSINLQQAQQEYNSAVEKLEQLKTAQEALEKAFDEGYKDDEIAELDMYDVLVEGNVCYTYQTKTYVEEIE